MGIPVEFTQAGYLWMATAPEHLRIFEANAALQRRHGSRSSCWTAPGVAKKAPYVRSDDLLGGVFHAATDMPHRRTT
jgi:hypothetical protein